MRSFNGVYLLLILLFILLIIYFSLVKSKPIERKSRSPVRKKKLANVRKHVKAKHSAEEEKRRNIKDFKERILKEIKKTEAKTEDAFASKRGSFFAGPEEVKEKEEKPKEENSGFANMFG